MMMYIRTKFEVSSNWISNYLGTPSAFMFACLSILLWAIMGPFSNYSDSWQLVANTFTTLATFLMMFLLQNTGNRTITEMHDRLANLESQNDLMLKILRGDIVCKDGMMFNYSALTDEELAARDEHAEELLANSTLVWQSESL